MADSFLRRMLRPVPAANQQAIEALTDAVRELADAQRKQAAQLKKLVEAQKESDHRWQEAIERVQRDASASARRMQHDADKEREKIDKRAQASLDMLMGSYKTEQKWRVIFSNQVNAMIRALHLPRLRLAAPHDLTARRFRLWSQNEEDGIILALLERAGVTNERFVEIGSGRSGGNAAMLAYECGWSGLMIDLVPSAIESLRAKFSHNPGVIGVAARITPDNVNQLLAEHGFAGDVDLLSIDIDSYDYWVLEALTVCSPRILMLEYNARFGPERAVTIPKDQSLDGAPKGYNGASLAALEKLARTKGYRLVVCDPTGVNAFFLRHDVAPDVPAVPVVHAFRPARSRLELDDVPVTVDQSLLSGALPLVEV
jgi:hypothetical protein